MSDELRPLPTNKPISLGGWQFGFGAMDPIIAEAAGEAIQNTFEMDGCRPYATLPWMWAPECDGNGGSAVTDSATIYVHIPALSSVEVDDGPTFSVSLEGLIQDFLDAAQPELFGALSERLRKLADAIDAEAEKSK